MPRRVLIISSLALSLVAAPQAAEDPVLKARAQRAAQGGGEGDLPPVPRGVVEPPPLPPPEAHVKDSKASRQAKGKSKKGKKGKASASKAKAPAPKAKAPAKGKGK